MSGFTIDTSYVYRLLGPITTEKVIRTPNMINTVTIA